MDSLKFHILKTQEFNDWLKLQTDVVNELVLARLQRVSIDGHFGTIHHFNDIIELKWKSGLRVYTSRIDKMVLVVLGGGNKNGQSKDIRQAKKILVKVKNTFVGSS